MCAIDSNEWTTRDELLFRREIFRSDPERAKHLAPAAPVDWCARMMTREFAPPVREPYRGPERRRATTRR